MSRRVRLPGADELFRSTASLVPSAEDQGTVDQQERVGSTGAPAVGEVSVGVDGYQDAPPGRQDGARVPQRRGSGVRHTGRSRTHDPDRLPSGRERHDEKITVYCSAEELIDLEHARLALRGEHGLAVDRGRIVREALAVVIADLDAKGEASILVRRLRGR